MQVTFQDVCDHFGGKSSLARLLDITPAAVTKWRYEGVSSNAAIEIERLSDGKFKAVEIEGLKDE